MQCIARRSADPDSSADSVTGTAAENSESWFVPAIATPVSVALLEAAVLQTGERASTAPAVPD